MTRSWLTTLLCTALISTAMAGTPKNGESLDRVVAVVNDAVITQSELSFHTKAATQQLKATNKPLPNPSALRDQVLDRLILETLQLQIAKRNNMDVSNEELSKAIQKMAEDSHLSLEQLKKEIEHDGINFNTFRKRIHDQMIISRLQQSALSSKININDKEVKDYLHSPANKKLGSSEYHLLHILVPLPETPSTAQIQTTEQRANKIVSSIKSGADFVQVATNNSTGTDALSGGDLGWRKAAQLPTLFANTLASLKLGEIAGPIRAPNGFHILKLVDVRNDPTKMTESQVKDLIYRRKFEENLQVWLDQLRDSAYIKKTL